MGRQVTIKSPAKINLTLDIINKNSDGYHNMEMVMQSIDFFDEIKIKKTGLKNIVVTDKSQQIPPNSISYRAAEAFFEYAGIENDGIEINIENNIPQCAGLAGGSADGAAVLVGLNILFDAKLLQDELCKIGVKIGADVPFCIVGGTAFARGIGEKITKIRPLKKGTFVVVKPEWGVSTPEAFDIFDKASPVKSPDNEAMINAIKTENLEEIGKNLSNVFQYVFSNDDVEQICAEMKDMGALGACMTGSGSAVFGLFKEEQTAKDCLDNLKNKYENAFLAKPFDKGAVLADEN